MSPGQKRGKKFSKMRKEDFRKISDYLWEIPKSFRPDMRVPARIYTLL